MKEGDQVGTYDEKTTGFKSHASVTISHRQEPRHLYLTHFLTII
jgi:hypothetical protein